VAPCGLFERTYPVNQPEYERPYGISSRGAGPDRFKQPGNGRIAINFGANDRRHCEAPLGAVKLGPFSRQSSKLSFRACHFPRWALFLPAAGVDKPRGAGLNS
jgi:hypothetical protein